MKRLALLILFAMPASAQNLQCAPRATVLSNLEHKCGESLQFAGKDRRGGLVEVFASAATGKWTATVTTPDQMTCLVAHGDDYKTFLPGDRT